MLKTTNGTRNGIHWPLAGEPNGRLNLSRLLRTVFPQSSADAVQLIKTAINHLVRGLRHPPTEDPSTRSQRSQHRISDERPREVVETFTYVGIVIKQPGGTDADVKVCIGSFTILTSIWKSHNITTHQNSPVQ